MRVLFVARSAKFDGTSSLSNVPRLVVHRMLMEDPTLNIVWLVPRTIDDEQLHSFLISPLPDEVQPRLTFVKATGHGFDRMVGYFSTEEIWAELNQAKTKDPYDLVVTQQAPLVPAYKAILMNRMMSSRYSITTPWVIWHLWTATLSQMEEVPEYYMGEADVAAELMGCYHADLNIWESNYLLQDALKSMRKWFQPAAVKKVIETSQPVHVGVEVDRMDEAYERRMERLSVPGAKRRLLWASRFANQKKPRVSFSQMRKVQLELAAKGRSYEVVVSSSQPIPEWATNEYHDWLMFPNQDRDGWFNVLGMGDVVLCNSVSEGYGTTWIEMLAAGALVVFERSWWNEQLLPDWYPFIADDKQEQVLLAKALLEDDGTLWDKYVPMVRDWIKAEQSDKTSGPRMLELLHEQFDKALEADSAIGRGTVAKLVSEAADSVASNTEDGIVEMREVFAAMSNISDSERDWGKNGDPISMMYLRRGLQCNGWEDLGGPTPTFRKVK